LVSEELRFKEIYEFLALPFLELIVSMQEEIEGGDLYDT
jgi:hypothetical protein